MAFFANTHTDFPDPKNAAAHWAPLFLSSKNSKTESSTTKKLANSKPLLSNIFRQSVNRTERKLPHYPTQKSRRRKYQYHRQIQPSAVSKPWPSAYERLLPAFSESANAWRNKNNHSKFAANQFHFTCVNFLLIVFCMKSFSTEPADFELEELLYGKGHFEMNHEDLVRSLMPLLLLDQPQVSNQQEKLLFEHLAKIGRRQLVLTLCEETQDHLTITSARIA